MNLRLSYGFRLPMGTRVDAIAEIFNMFNAKNPAIPLTTSQFTTAGAPNSGFMQPTAFTGDFQAGEQRVGQLGFRFTF